MTALQTLRTLGRATAAKVAEVSGMDIIRVYTELVAAEAAEKCRVVVIYDGKKVGWIEWVAA
jgi:hypothetical protein